jgi:uncharacterized lipoprotein YajG
VSFLLLLQPFAAYATLAAIATSATALLLQPFATYATFATIATSTTVSLVLLLQRLQP